MKRAIDWHLAEIERLRGIKIKSRQLHRRILFHEISAKELEALSTRAVNTVEEFFTVGPRPRSETHPNDIIHTEGFPKGWFVQDRVGDNVALLCKEISFPIPGGYCLCLRPKSISTKEWLRTAAKIAEGYELMLARDLEAAQNG